MTKNIIQYFKPWYILANIFGLVPYQIIKINLEFKVSIKGIATFIILYSNFFYSFYLYFPDIEDSDRISTFINAGDYLFYNILAISYLLVHLYYSKEFFKILKKIINIDILFESLNIKFQYEKLKRKFIINISFIFFIFIILYSFYRYFCDEERALPIYKFINYYLIEQFRALFIIRSYTLIIAIKERFVIINNCLMKYSRHVSKPKIINENEILKLRIVHDELCDVCEIFNKTESVPVILSLGSFFMITISNIFYTFMAWYHRTDYWAMRIVHTSLLVGHFGVIGLGLIPGFAKISQEANRAGIIIHKIVGENDHVDGERELKLFSNQLLHRKVNFSAQGFFPLDYSLIFSIAGTITTYLVILIQFETLNQNVLNSTISDSSFKN